MKNSILLCFLLFLCTANAQVKGVVKGMYANDKKEPLYGAKIRLLKGEGKAITGEDGTFKLILDKKNLPDTMVVTAMGFNADTIVVTRKDRFASFEITLYSDQLLPEVIVARKQEAKSFLRLKILGVENLSSAELRKAACCNLSESFETNVSVDVSISDAVSGAKKIQMMGLNGVYTQFQMENIPYLRGLDTYQGLHSIPGSWINSIQITKGSGTVVNGYESMAGLINLTMKHPETMEKLYINGYTNRFGRAELNINNSFKLGEKWKSSWMASGSYTPGYVDENQDGFRDFPEAKHGAFFNRYAYEGENMEAQLGFDILVADKTGGQIGFRDFNDTLFGAQINSESVNAFAKTGFFLKKPLHSIGLIYNAKYQRLGARFGNRNFRGVEHRGYFNAIYNGIFGNSMHNYKTGLSAKYLDIEQRINTDDASRVEVVPGAFFEYTYKGARVSAVLGARYDYHSIFAGQFSPRMHSKFVLSENTDLRLTAGRGWRVPNYMVDNLSLLASGREWIAPDTIIPAISWNFGGSFIQRFKLFGLTSNITLDFYHTLFENQLIVDRDQDVEAFIFKNNQDGSYSNSFQAELDLAILNNLDLRLAYKWLQVRANLNGEIQQMPFVPKHRGFVNLAYQTRNRKWEYDLTTSIFGRARLPIAELENGSLTTKNESDIVPRVSAQVTYTHKRVEVYLGGENLLNYTQKDPIINVENPFSTTFDATRIWAPIVGANVYVGFRFTIEREKEE